MATRDIVNVGTIGHVDHGKATITAALTRALIVSLLSETFDVSDMPEVKPIVVMAPPPDPFNYCGISERKSKGAKRRDRAERRSKGWR